MSERDIEEWEEGLEPIWEALVNFVADAPLLLEEVKRLREANRSLFLQLSDVQGQLNRIHRGEEE
jgi:hypothetical protein